MHALAGNEWRMGNAVAVRGCSHFKCSPGCLWLLYSVASFSKKELTCSEQHIHPAHTQIGPSVANASFHGARFLSRHSLTHTYTQTCCHSTPFCHPIPFPIHYLQFARDLNAVKNGFSLFLIAFDNNFVKAPLAAGEEQSHQQL